MEEEKEIFNKNYDKISTEDYVTVYTDNQKQFTGLAWNKANKKGIRYISGILYLHEYKLKVPLFLFLEYAGNKKKRGSVNNPANWKICLAAKKQDGKENIQN